MSLRPPGCAIRFLQATLVAAAATICPARAAAPPEPVKVVYHLDEGKDQAQRALRNIRNHLEADPGVTIVVVAYGPGIDFLIDEAKDSGGYPFALTVEQLAKQGVRFEVCNNTLEARHLDKNKLIPEATVVPSGVAEIARLQAREGFAYLKP